MVLDLAGDEGSVADLSTSLDKPKKEVEKFDRPFRGFGFAATFGQLYKSDGRAGRDADGDGLVNERERPAAAALRQPAPVRAIVSASGRPIWSASPPEPPPASVSRPRPRRSPAHCGGRPTRQSGPPATASPAPALWSALRRSVWAVALSPTTSPTRTGWRRSASSTTSPRRRAASGSSATWPRPGRRSRGERANYDRPLDGKPITEAGLPDYQSAQSFAKATQAAFPEGTQFTVKIRRHSVTPDIKKPDEVTELSTVETRFVKGGMTGRDRPGLHARQGDRRADRPARRLHHHRRGQGQRHRQTGPEGAVRRVREDGCRRGGGPRQHRRWRLRLGPVRLRAGPGRLERACARA